MITIDDFFGGFHQLLNLERLSKILDAGLRKEAFRLRIHDVSRATLQIPQGSLYPALHRLERRGWISAAWGTSENNRKARFYQLTRTVPVPA